MLLLSLYLALREAPTTELLFISAPRHQQSAAPKQALLAQALLTTALHSQQSEAPKCTPLPQHHPPHLVLLLICSIETTLSSKRTCYAVLRD